MMDDLDLVHFTVAVSDGLATVRMDLAGESMNTIGEAFATELGEIVARLTTDDDVTGALFISGKKSGFLAGADIRMMRHITDEASALDMINRGQAVFTALHDLHAVHGKPVAAAIHGPALGGGLEIALACSIRVASLDATFGQPEVQIGILPAGGGTQRLPRLIGLPAALDLLLTGKTIDARRAKKLGLVDEVVHREHLFDAAVERVRAAMSAPTDTPSTIDRLRGLLDPSNLQRLATEDTPVGRNLVFKKALEQVMDSTGGHLPAPLATLETVRTGYDQGIVAGLAAERSAFARLVVTPEAQALRGIFFATQELKKDNGTTDPNVDERPVSTVGVLGGGLMGGGIAAVNATRAGVRTRIKEIDSAGIHRALAYVGKVVHNGEKKRKLTRQEAVRARHSVTADTEWRGFADVDVVIEAVFEDLTLKQEMLRLVEEQCRPDTIFASNTSSIPISRIAEAAGRPENVIGMHYFSPVEKMPLLEVIVTPQTADEVTATCVALGKRQGKTVIVVNDGVGFYTTRILGPYGAEVAHLLAEGATIEDIDGAARDLGFPVGPVTLSDEVGIDTQAKIAVILAEAFGDRFAGPNIAQVLVEAGRKGRKNGRGFYRYEDGTRTGVDESVYRDLGVDPTGEVARHSIGERLLLALVNEAARCLEDGVLRSARDGDIGAVFGIGFPAHTGGPFMWIDQQGAAEVVARLSSLQAVHGPRFAPAEILGRYAAEGRRFRDA